VGPPSPDAAGLEWVDAGLPEVAVLMAAVTGDLDEAPGLVMLDAGDLARPPVRAALAHAGHQGAPLLVMTRPGPAATPSTADRPGAGPAPVKAHLEVASGTAGATVAHAVRLVLAEPPGPVRLDLPPGGLALAVDGEHPLGPDAAPPPDRAALDRAAGALAGAARPVLVIGRRCRSLDAAAWLRPLVETLPAPAFCTARARGVLPDPHPLAFGVAGTAPAWPALLARADLVVLVGVDRHEGVPDLPAAVPRLSLGPPAGDVQGSVAAILEELAPGLRGRSRGDWDVAALDRLKRGGAPAPGGALTAVRALRVVREVTPAGTLVAADPGVAAEAVAGGWQAVGPADILMAPAPGTTAVGVAVAASLARPDAAVIAVTAGPDLAADPALDVARRRGTPIVVVWLGEGDAAGTGLPMQRVAQAGHLSAALAGALAARRPGVVAVAPV
jgi:acetolactate synthase-1/2/3 large subunit